MIFTGLQFPCRSDLKNELHQIVLLFSDPKPSIKSPEVINPQ